MKHNISKQGVIYLFLDRVMYNSKIASNPKASDLKKVFNDNINKITVKRMLNNINSLKDKYNIYEDGVINDVIYYLLLAIENCELTEIQRQRLELWLDGYTEEEIGNICGVSRRVAHKTIEAACEKIIRYLARVVV